MPQPNKIPRPFADSGDKNSIPDSSGSIGFASWQEGFPAITGTPFAQGGVAPKRADFNGIFNALSAATVWQQQGGVYDYDNATDYEVGNVAVDSGALYICKTANGPGSSIKDPTADTTETYWARLYPQSGTFNRMFFSQVSGSYIAPYTGVYRITLKGGGGGGGGRVASTYATGGGGGEGGTLIFYVTLTQGQSYSYTIGAGGAGGSNDASASSGMNGGSTLFSNDHRISGGYGGYSDSNSNGGGQGGYTMTVPSGVTAYMIPGQSGQSGCRGAGAWCKARAMGGGNSTSSSGGTPYYGAGGSSAGGRAGNTYDALSGADGYILIEYAG